MLNEWIVRFVLREFILQGKNGRSGSWEMRVLYFSYFMIDGDIDVHQCFDPRFDRTGRELLTGQFNQIFETIGS